MENITISLKTLYDKFGDNLEHGDIVRSGDNGQEYYDFYNTDNVLVCIDGETCEVIESDRVGNITVLLNLESDFSFALTNEEIDIGSFSSR